MSGALRKMGVYLGLVEDGERYNARYDDEYDDYDEYDDEPAETEQRSGAAARGARDTRDTRDGRDLRDARDDRGDLRTDVRDGSRSDGYAGRDERDHRDEPGAVVSRFPDRRVPSAPEVTELARITTVHPRSYNEARVIGEHFRDGTPVIMNLTEMDHADAKRLVDFAAGLIFCCRGSIERITTKVFLVCPPNITLAAEEKEQIAADGFYNQS